MCVPSTHRLVWSLGVRVRNLVLTVTGHLRLATRNSTLVICAGSKFEEGKTVCGSFDCRERARNEEAAGGGGGVAAGLAQAQATAAAAAAAAAESAMPKEDVEGARHGFVVFTIAGSSSFRATTVDVSFRLVPLS